MELVLLVTGKVFNLQSVFDKHTKDLLGLKPNATKQELKCKEDEFEELVFSSAENPEELAERLLDAAEPLQVLLMQSMFNPSSIKEEEVAKLVETVLRVGVGVGLPEGATRDEIKATVQSYFLKVK